MRRLVDEQFPQWRALPIQRVSTAGTVNAIFRRPPHFVTPMYTYRQAILWLEAEHANLHAAADNAAASGHTWYAVAISAATAGFLDIRGYLEEASPFSIPR